MEVTEPDSTSSAEGIGEISTLRVRLARAEARLAEAQELIQAIQQGEVDAVVVSGPEGDQVFTLKHAEYAYRALVEAMNEGAATLGVGGIVLYCNQRLSHLLGVPLEQIIGSPMVGLFESRAARVFEALLAQALSGQPCTAELYLHGSDARLIPVQVSISEMKSVEPAALCIVVTDLTERKKRDEIIAQGRLSASILESAAEAIAVCNESGVIISTNGALDSLCESNFLLKHFDAVLPLELVGEPGTEPKYVSIFDALAGRTIVGREVLLRRKDERSVSLLLSASPIWNGSSIVGCVITMTDITSRKRAEEALLRSEKLASVGRMAATISHEINNPLEAVGQLLYLAMIQPDISQEIKSYLETAVQELDRVSHITQQALAFRRDAGSAAPVDLRCITEDVMRLFASRLRTRGIEIKTRYRGANSISAFGGEIRQVIANLVSNSMDAVPSGGRIEIRISAVGWNHQAPAVRLSVADTGSGIAPERLKNIFEPFFTTKELVGTGLGLWVSKQIIEKHGARIKVRSKPGAGTVFSILFPDSGAAIKP